MRRLISGGLATGIMAGILTVGCTSSPPIAPERKATISTLKSTYDELKSDSFQLDSMNSAIDRALITTDLAQWYKDYDASLDKLETAGRDTERQYWDIKQQTQQFEVAWDKEIATNPDPQVQETMMQRKQRVSAAFDRIINDAMDLRDSYKPYLTDLRAINSALKMDLSAGGMASLKPAFEKAKRDGAVVSQKLDKYSTELDRLAGRMAATNPTSMPTTAPTPTMP